MANFLRCVWYYVSFLGLAGATRTESRERNVATEQHDVGANSPTAHTQPSLLERSPHYLGRPVKLTDINTHLTHLACALQVPYTTKLGARPCNFGDVYIETSIMTRYQRDIIN